MSETIKIEEENDSEDNLEVRRSSARSVQTYRPHKRAQPTSETAENTCPAKQPRMNEPHMPETRMPETSMPETPMPENLILEPIISEILRSEPQMSVPILPELRLPELRLPELRLPEPPLPEPRLPEPRLPEPQMSNPQMSASESHGAVSVNFGACGSHHPEIIINVAIPRFSVCDCNGTEHHVHDNSIATAQDNDQPLRIDPNVVVISDSEDEQDNEPRVVSARPNPLSHTEYEAHVSAIRNLTDFLRFVRRNTGEYTPVRHHSDGWTAQQHFMWLQQMGDAELRRRHATSESTSGASRIHIGPPFMRTIESSFPPGREELQDRRRINIANNAMNRFTVLYPYAASSSENHELKSCVVCITEFQIGQAVRRLPCLHIFHKECVDKWIFLSMKCPICRHELIPQLGPE